MKDMFQNIGMGLSGFGAGYQDPSFGPRLIEARRKEEAEKENAKILGNILSEQSIPAYARAGGVEPQSPEQIRRTKLMQLGQLGTPEALRAMVQLGDPEQIRQREMKQRAMGTLAPMIAQKYGISPEQASSLLMGGVEPSALGTLFAKPERKIIEQDGIQYYTDTGQPVIASPVKPLGSKELKEVTIPGLDIVEGAIPTKDDAKTIKNIKQAKTQIEGLVADYENLVKEYGYEPSYTKGGKLIRQKKAQIDLQAKNLEELGALQEADRAILGDMLGDPTGLTNPYNAQDIALTQIQDYKKYINDRYNTALSTRGYQESDAGITPQKALEELRKRGAL